MTERKYTDEEIITGLNYCANLASNEGCDDCPIKAECGSIDDRFVEAVADLINRQKAEIERLSAKMHEQDLGYRRAIEQCVREQNINLHEAYSGCQERVDRARKQLKTAKAEAIKEFAERLKEELSFGKYIQPDQIDNLVKEMLAEKCENQDENLRKNVKVIGEQE